MLDALWLSFASYYAMWLIFGGLLWAATALIAFTLYKVALMLLRWITVYPSKLTRDLTFLRVFSLGRRSDRLLNRVARYWRHIGNVQIITGPDVARSTVHPHQFLDFLSGSWQRISCAIRSRWKAAWRNGTDPQIWTGGFPLAISFALPTRGSDSCHSSFKRTTSS